MGILDNIASGAQPVQAPDNSALLASLAMRAGLPAAQPQQPPAAPAAAAQPAAAQKPQVIWTRAAPTAPINPGDIVNGQKYVGGPKNQESSWQPLTGKDYFATLPPDRQRLVQSILNVKMPMPQGFVMKDPYWKQIAVDVTTTDPSLAGSGGGFDQKAWAARQQLLKSFTAGQDAKTIAALRMGTQHAAGMQGAYDNLGNWNEPGWLNRIKQDVEYPFSQKIRSGYGAAALNSKAVGGEAASVFAGGAAPSVTEQQNYESSFSPYAAPDESNAALGKLVQLYNSRLNVLQQKWKDGMGPLAPDYPIIDPQTQAAWQQLTSRYDPETGQLIPPQQKQAGNKGAAKTINFSDLP